MCGEVKLCVQRRRNVKSQRRRRRTTTTIVETPSKNLHGDREKEPKQRGGEEFFNLQREKVHISLCMCVLVFSVKLLKKRKLSCL